MAIIELQFPVVGSAVTADHGYALYAALAHLLTPLHSDEVIQAIGPIEGQYVGDNRLLLGPDRSRLRLRMSPSEIATVLPLAGKEIEVSGHKLRLGVPMVQALMPASRLIARIVTIKGFTEAKDLIEAARRQLENMQIAAPPSVPLIMSGEREGQPRRRIITIKGKRVVGYCLLVTGLTADESIRLQEHGIGGRRKMGCGFFVQARTEEEGA